MQKLIYTTITCLVCLASVGQTKFISAGKIEYERKINQYAFMDESNAWDELMRKSLPKFYTSYYDLIFKDGRTLYKQGRDADANQRKYWGVLDVENVVLANLDSNTAVTQKNIGGDMFLVKDSIRHIAWKLSPEIRKIAGFDCRKAVGKIMDSIVVIAFYAVDIVTSGGPESFAGLPGMIMGLAIPRLHTTWYATRLQLTDVSDKDLPVPQKGKKITGADYRALIKKFFNPDGKSSGTEWQYFL